MNIMQGLIAGAQIKQDLALEKALTEEPRLRGGNSGCLDDQGRIIGRDGREAVLRYFGVDKTFTYRELLMFAAGEKAEEILMDWLAHSWEGKILNQVEAEWTTDAGIKVTCRGDIGLADKDGNLLHGIENKNASSVWTAGKVAPFGKYRDNKPMPKIDAICQAAHYSMANGFLPWSIIYTSTNSWSIAPTQKALRQFDGWPEYFDRRPGEGNVNIKPFLSVFHLEWENNRVYLTHEETGFRIKTPVTAEGIRGYYELLAQCVIQRRLPERTITVDAYGRKESWSLYAPEYNDYSALHDKYDKGQLTFDQFLEQAKLAARGLPSN